MRLTTIRKGYISENIIKNDLLKRNLELYEPVVDDKSVDLLVVYLDTVIRVQVKGHTYMNTKSSISIRVTPTNADVIAVPWEGNAYYMINKTKNKQWGFSFAVKPTANNQKEGVRFIHNYKDFPTDNEELWKNKNNTTNRL